MVTGDAQNVAKGGAAVTVSAGWGGPRPGAGRKRKAPAPAEPAAPVVERVEWASYRPQFPQDVADEVANYAETVGLPLSAAYRRAVVAGVRALTAELRGADD
jgi:hypothetical protein